MPPAGRLDECDRPVRVGALQDPRPVPRTESGTDQLDLARRVPVTFRRALHIESGRSGTLQRVVGRGILEPQMGQLSDRRQVDGLEPRSQHHAAVGLEPTVDLHPSQALDVDPGLLQL